MSDVQIKVADAVEAGGGVGPDRAATVLNFRRGVEIIAAREDWPEATFAQIATGRGAYLIDAFEAWFLEQAR